MTLRDTRHAYFNSRSPCGERSSPRSIPGSTRADFNSRSPCGERSSASPPAASLYLDFNSRSPCGERYLSAILWPMPLKFQLTLPMRGAMTAVGELRIQEHISTHAPHAGSDYRSAWIQTVLAISTHAPHAGSDRHCSRLMERTRISTHAPHAGSDTCRMVSREACGDFNSRSPCGERFRDLHVHRRMTDFNSRSPCGERFAGHYALIPSVIFQLTLPMRGAMLFLTMTAMVFCISTHAPHAGSDRPKPWMTKSSRRFQLTLPMRGAIAAGRRSHGRRRISTHAPHAGSDR